MNTGYMSFHSGKPPPPHTHTQTDPSSCRATWPYETMLLPKRHILRLTDLTEDEVKSKWYTNVCVHVLRVRVFRFGLYYEENVGQVRQSV